MHYVQCHVPEEITHVYHFFIADTKTNENHYLKKTPSFIGNENLTYINNSSRVRARDMGIILKGYKKKITNRGIVLMLFISVKNNANKLITITKNKVRQPYLKQNFSISTVV